MTLPARSARVTYARLAATRHTDPAEEDRGHRSVHEKRAREIWFLCRTYDAATALEWGLVNAVVERSELHAEVRHWAEGLAEFSDRRPPDFSGFR